MPLHFAGVSAELEASATLLKRGADVNATGIHRHQASMRAVARRAGQHGAVEVVNLLL